MRFIEFHKPSCDKKTIEFIDMLINKKIFNDAVFETCFIQAEVELDSPVQMYYRTLWETMYLRRSRSCDIINNKHAIIMMSISECIQYLQEITPPKMRKLLDDEMTSVSKIQEMITGFLQDTTDPNHPYYLTKFYEVFHLNLFNNAWIPEYKKISFVRNNIHDDIICLVDAATESINTMLSESENCEFAPFWAQVTFHTDTEDGMELLYRFLWHNDLHISGVQCNDIGLFVSAYTNRLCPGLSKAIKRTYTLMMK